MIDTANGVWAATLAHWLTVTMPAIVPPPGWFHFLHHQRHHQWYHRSNDYSTLPEGIWSGDVSVQFDAPGPVNLSDVPAGVPPCFIPDGIVMKKHLLPLALLFSGISRPRRWMSAIYHRL